MSLPGENAFSPAPRRMMQRTPSSADSVSIASPRRPHIARVRALSFSGRLSTTVAIGPARSTRIASFMSEPSAIEDVDQSKRGRRHVGDEEEREQQDADER